MWRFLKRAFTRDIPLKLSSAGLAVLIMMLILAVRMQPRKFQGVEVDLADIPPNTYLRENWGPSKIDLTIRGPKAILDEIKGKVSVEVSLAGRGAGHHRIPLTQQNVKIAVPESHRKRVQVDSEINEWEVECYLEMYTREIPVAKPVLEGTPLPGWYCDQTMLEMKPEKIKVTAPPALLDELQREDRKLPLLTVAINVSGAEEVWHRRYRVDFEALGVEPVDPEEKWVEVTIHLEKSDYQKELTVGNVQVRNLPPTMQSSFATEQKIMAVVEGRESVVESLQPNHLTAWLDASLVLDATDYVPIEYEVVGPTEPQIEVKSWKPETIKLKVSPKSEPKEKVEGRSGEG